MADIKFTGLAASSGVPDNGSVMAISTYDGVSTYTSEKYTMTQLKDIVYVMEAEDKITFDSSGTNKAFVTSTGTSRIAFDIFVPSDIEITTDNGGYAQSWAYLGDGSTANAGAGFGYGANNLLVEPTGEISLQHGAVKKIRTTSTGIGFYGTAPIAKPTSVAVTAAGIHAALVSLGLIS